MTLTFSKADWRQLGKRAVLVIALLLALIFIGLIINAESARRAAGGFELANDLPRGALVYAQCRDLPALLKQWDESALKERYLASTSFQHLQTRHLALKLIARWEEFNAATGFAIDSAALSSLADNRAAVAIYDIGRLDLVLLAPLSETKLALSRFWQGKDNFEEIALPDGTNYYLADVEADRGRQKQQLGFALVRGRFVLATDEKLLLRTLANLNGAGKPARKDRLTDEPAFQTLSRAVAPHFVTVWVDQARLNDDWYFRRYWVMRNVAELKHLRAGIFDLELQRDKWIERREFLLTPRAAPTRAVLPQQTWQQLERLVPADIPFVQVRALDGKQNAAVELVRTTLFDRQLEPLPAARDWNWRNYDDSDFEVSTEDEEFYGASRYAYLSHRYNLMIDDPDDARENGTGEHDEAALRRASERQFAVTLRAALRAAQPVLAAKVAQPRALDEPLFAEFNRAAIIALQNPAGLERQTLERAIGELAASRMMIAGARANWEWHARALRGVEWREMSLPMLGRALGYGVRGQYLIIANSSELLAALFSEQPAQAKRAGALSSSLHELTVIRLQQRQQAFDQIFNKLDAPRIKAYWEQRRGAHVVAGGGQPAQEFFSGEVASLLDVAAPVTEMRIERSFAAGRLREQVELRLK